MSRPRIFWSGCKSRVDAHDAAIARQRKHEERERQAAIPRKARELCDRILNGNDGSTDRMPLTLEAMARELLALLDGKIVEESS